MLCDSDKWEAFATFLTWKVFGTEYQNMYLISADWELVLVMTM